VIPIPDPDPGEGALRKLDDLVDIFHHANQAVWKQREIAMLADSGWSETALES
jgi:hypothetical protein